MFEWLHDHTSIYIVQSVRRCQNSQSENKLGKFISSSSDPQMPSKAVKELNGKRKRDDNKVIPIASGNYPRLRLQKGQHISTSLSRLFLS